MVLKLRTIHYVCISVGCVVDRTTCNRGDTWSRVLYEKLARLSCIKNLLKV